MKNKKLWLAMLVMALVSGMMLVGCDDGSTDDNGNNNGGNGGGVTVSSGQTKSQRFAVRASSMFYAPSDLVYASESINGNTSSITFYNR